MKAGNLQEGDGACDPAIRGALRKLSRTNVTAIRLVSGGMALTAKRNGAASARGEISEEHWALLEERGWVVPEEDGTWRLSNAGRIQLKRLLSRSEAAAGQSHVQADCARQKPNAAELNVAESPLAWLYRRTDRYGRPLISQAQFEAGERLRSDFERGHMSPRLTVNWSSAGGVSPGSARPDYEIELHGHAIAARERVRAALAAVGPELSGILIEVCCHLRGLAEVERDSGWPQRSAKVVLLMALTTLARHYGLISSGDETRSRLRHWGGENYRPEIQTNSSG
jgi:hypothetical protein